MVASSIFVFFWTSLSSAHRGMAAVAVYKTGKTTCIGDFNPVHWFVITGYRSGPDPAGTVKHTP
jgi:hypothetical protein